MRQMDREIEVSTRTVGAILGSLNCFYLRRLQGKEVLNGDYPDGISASQGLNRFARQEVDAGANVAQQWP